MDDKKLDEKLDPKDLSADELASLDEAKAKGVAAWVRVECNNGDIHPKLIGGAKNCAGAFHFAEVMAIGFCESRGGVKQMARVKCPV